MGIEQTLAYVMRHLPPDKQQSVLDFAQSLAMNGPTKPLRSLKGLCEDLNVNITAEDIDEARRDMWSGFPREDIL